MLWWRRVQVATSSDSNTTAITPDNNNPQSTFLAAIGASLEWKDRDYLLQLCPEWKVIFAVSDVCDEEIKAEEQSYAEVMTWEDVSPPTRSAKFGTFGTKEKHDNQSPIPPRTAEQSRT